MYEEDHTIMYEESLNESNFTCCFDIVVNIPKGSQNH